VALVVQVGRLDRRRDELLRAGRSVVSPLGPALTAGLAGMLAVLALAGIVLNEATGW